ncbi:MAG TPA: hypothetical protein VFN21_12525 [Acidimicrobiales bacterium]|nr:hypothetical protein [Acidimicrobiales bacterium]
MARPTRFEEFRWLGDKRTQIVHDLDNCEAEVVDELMESGQFAAFGPDTVDEARNRGYRPCACAGAVVARAAQSS